MVVEVLPCSGCFITCMGAHFPAVELDNAIRFSILSRMSGFLWHSSKWACRFGRFLLYTSGLEVLACILNNDINYMTTMLQLHLSLNHSCSNFWGRDVVTFWVKTFWVYSSGRSLLLIATILLCKLSYQQIKLLNKNKLNTPRN